MKRTLLVLASVATVSLLSGCMATAMKTGEGIIRSMTPANAGILTTAGNTAADTYKMVRGGVLGDTSLAPNDPAAVSVVPQEEALSPPKPEPVVVTPVPPAPKASTKKQPAKAPKKQK